MKTEDQKIQEAAEKYCEKYNHGVRESVIDAILGFNKEYNTKPICINELNKEFDNWAKNQDRHELTIDETFNWFLPYIKPTNVSDAIEFVTFCLNSGYIWFEEKKLWFYFDESFEKPTYTMSDFYTEFITQITK